MSTGDRFPIPTHDPISGSELYISELHSTEGDITIRGRFEIPLFARLDDEQYRFLITFLRCRGMITSVERELGISYPTVRSRLDSLLKALDLAPVAEEKGGKKMADEKRKILDQLEQGKITAAEAKKRLRGGMDE